MCEEEYSAATDFFCNIMTPEDVLLVDVLLNYINRAPAPAKRYFEKHCRDAKELEEFFKDHDYLFYLENKRVALHEDKLEEAAKMSMDYFAERLEIYGQPVDYMKLKMENLEHAPKPVCQFMTRFYPGKEIKNFFKQRNNIFVVHKDNTVFLVEKDSVEFYRKLLKPGQKVRFNSFRGNVGQAPPHVQKFINLNFNGDDFQDFLIRNKNVFKLDENGFVSLKPGN